MNRGRFTSTNTEWGTPMYLFKEIEKEFGEFDLDPCASKENAKCKKYFTKEHDGLTQNWQGKVFMNPPYGAELPLWMEKARKSGCFVVCLVPSRTDTKWWHENVENIAKVKFIKGRIKFEGAKWNAPFSSALIIYESHDLP